MSKDTYIILTLIALGGLIAGGIGIKIKKFFNKK